MERLREPLEDLQSPGPTSAPPKVRPGHGRVWGWPNKARLSLQSARCVLVLGLGPCQMQEGFLDEVTAAAQALGAFGGISG